MNKLCIGVGTFVGSYAGWYLCDRFGMVAAFIGSGIGSIVGVYAGWKIARKIEE